MLLSVIYQNGEEHVYLLPIGSFNFCILSGDFGNLSINPRYIWIFNPDMRTHNNIHRSPLHIQIKIVRSNSHDFVPCMHGMEMRNNVYELNEIDAS
jgi:hypothetical protein